MQCDLDFAPVATIIFNFASNVAAGLFVHWLLEKVQSDLERK